MARGQRRAMRAGVADDEGKPLIDLPRGAARWLSATNKQQRVVQSLFEQVADACQIIAGCVYLWLEGLYRDDRRSVDVQVETTENIEVVTLTIDVEIANLLVLKMRL